MTSPLPSLHHRFTALLAALCVLVLTLAAVNPQLHAGLHRHDEVAGQDGDAPAGDGSAAEAGHVCAVTLFAGGVLPLLLCIGLIVGLIQACAPVLMAGGLLAAAHPRYRLVPSHAPPLG